MAKRWLSPAAAAVEAGYASSKSIYGLIAAGKIKAHDIGTKGGRPTWRIDAAEIEEFVRCRRATPGAAVPRSRRSQSKTVTRYF